MSWLIAASFSTSNIDIFIIAGFQKTSKVGQVYIDKSCRYECRYCYKGFLFMSRLKQHKLIHTDNRPFKCDFCDKRYNDKTTLHHDHSCCLGRKATKQKIRVCDKLFK